MRPLFVFLRPKLKALLAQEGLLEKSMASLEKAASGKGLGEGESQAQVCASTAKREERGAAEVGKRASIALLL